MAGLPVSNNAHMHIRHPQGGVTFNMTRMDKVTSVHVTDFDCTVQAGVTRKALAAFLRDTGLWFPVGVCPYLLLCRSYNFTDGHYK